ncbi:glutaredoxin 2 [Aggregatibacter actinomycetemcomitans]|nr:glutaredoxin 2 [Aggregatibacter actinomycetemcomitans]
MKLYVYDHCPFCVRARMIFGLKNVPVELVTILNDDVETPTRLVGKKVVPILVKENGEAMPESLDIVRYIDEHNGEKVLSETVRPEVEAWLKQVGSYQNHLVIPRFTRLGLPEYATQSAVDYFTENKEKSIGDFAENLANTDTYLARLTPDLAQLAHLIQSDTALNGSLSLEDILVFPILRNLTCVKGIVFPPNVNAYVETLSRLSRVPLYRDKAI